MSAEYWVLKCDQEQWVQKFSEMAHLSSFGEFRPKSVERIDFALVVFRGGDPGGYVTCIEIDRDHLYWQIGGAFELYQKTPYVYAGFMKLLNWSLENYKMVSIKVVNENIRTIHLAMRMGFRIVGTWTKAGRVLVDMICERQIIEGD